MLLLHSTRFRARSIGSEFDCFNGGVISWPRVPSVSHYVLLCVLLFFSRSGYFLAMMDGGWVGLGDASLQACQPREKRTYIYRVGGITSDASNFVPRAKARNNVRNTPVYRASTSTDRQTGRYSCVRRPRA
jgi:hypothetical protein